MQVKSGIRFEETVGADGDNSFSKSPSVVLSESGHEIPRSSAHFCAYIHSNQIKSVAQQ